MSLSKADRTRQHIIEKAAPFFNKKGYADTSMADIVQATGLTKGAIYGNFENKDELALSVFDYNLSRLTAGIAQATAPASTASAKLLAMTAYYRNAYKTVAAQGGCPVMNAATEADDNFPLLKTRVRAALRGWKKTIIQIIEKGKDEKTMHKSIVAEKYAVLFIALIEGGIMLAKATDEVEHLIISLDRVDQIVKQELES